MMLAGHDVSRETHKRLQALTELVRVWTKTINLISRSTVDDIWNRHICDSAQIFPGNLDATTHWLDLGSGGGFPGLVCATVAAEKAPGVAFTLVESDKRKATFLRTAARELGLSVTVRADRIEQMPAQNASVISARALAPLADLLSLAHPHLNPAGQAIFLKGASASAEISSARADWDFALTTRPSITDPNGQILILESLRRA